MKKAICLFVCLFCAICVFSQEKFKGLVRETNELTGVNWYRIRGFSNCYTSLFTYVGESDGLVWMNAQFKYRGSDWIFFDKIYLLIDGEKIEIPFSQDDKSDDVTYGGGVSEKVNIQADDELMDIFKKVQLSQNTKLFFVGKNSQHSHEITKCEKNNIRNVFNAYESLNAKHGISQSTTSSILSQPSDTVPCYCSMKWGMNKSEVKDLETNPLVTKLGDDNKLVYNSVVYGTKAFVTYDFQQDKLKGILVLFQSSSIPIEQSYDQVYTQMENHYGEAVSHNASETTWIQDDKKIVLIIMKSNLAIFVTAYGN